jgi:hypothetical protein
MENAKPLTPTEALPNGGGGAGAGGDIHVDFSPVYNVGAGANAEELQKVLDDHDVDLKEKIEEILEDLKSDEWRRKY